MDYYHSSPASLEVLKDLEAGFSGHPSSRHPISPSKGPRRPFCDGAGELRQHYLDACVGCGHLLAGNKDIFMYRGDMPFCSEQCRQEQIEIDEAREKRSKHPTSRKEQQRQRQQQKQSPQRIPVWAW